MTATVLGFLAGLLGQTAPLPAGHPDIPPMAHANPSQPGAAEFDPNQALPPGHPAVGAMEDGGQGEASMSAKEILDRLDKMKAQLKGRPKTAEIEFALGNLYYENSRWPDAIDAYRQLLERAAGPLARYRALRDRARGSRAGSAQGHPADCELRGQPSFDAVIEAADALAKRKEVARALACYELALVPMTVALTRQGNAWYLIGNEDQAIADHEKALELAPDSSENLFFLGAILFEGGDGDVPRLKRAKDYWQRFLRSDPEPEREKLVSKDMIRLQLAIDNHGHIPSEMPPQMKARAVGANHLPPPPVPSLTAAQRTTLERRYSIGRGETALSAKHWQCSPARLSPRGRQAASTPEASSAARGEGIALLEPREALRGGGCPPRCSGARPG